MRPITVGKNRQDCPSGKNYSRNDSKEKSFTGDEREKKRISDQERGEQN